MKQLTVLVDQLLSQSQQNWHIKFRAEWHTIMGDLAKRARLERIQGSTVIIGVYDSHWMHELHALSRMIIQRINGALQQHYPQGFMITCLRCVWVTKKVAKKQRAGANKLAPSSFRQKKHSQQALRSVQKIDNKELQDSLLAYFQRCEYEKE